jgi:hypothetical protein
MFKRIYIFCIVLFIFKAVQGQIDLGQIQNLQGNGHITFKTLQQSIAKSSYNKFDKIYINYPSLEPNNLKVAIKPLNDFIYKKAFLEMQQEAFKYEFLPFAYGALASALGKNYPDNYAYYSTNMGIPTIQEVAPTIIFLSGDIMCYQVLYEFYFEPHSRLKIDGFTFVKTYYLQVSTGKEIPFLQLFEPTKQKALLSFLSNELNQMLGSNKAYLSSFKWGMADQLGGYNNDEYDEYEEEVEGEDGSVSIKKNPKEKLISFTKQDLELAFLNLTPFSAQIILPPFNSQFEEAKQLGLLFSIPFQTFSNFLPNNSLLGNWFSQQNGSTKLLSDLNVLQKQVNHFSQNINPLMNQSSFVRSVTKGVKTQSLFSVELIQGDSSILRLQRTAHYDTEGRLIKLVFGEGKNPESWLYFEYDKAGNLLSEIRYAYNQIEEQKTYSYNAQNCLVQVQSATGDELPNTTQYFYRDSFVYECPLVEVFNSMDIFKESNIQVYALDAHGNIKSMYGLNQIPRYISRFNQDKIMASYSLTHPNLDNAIYAYNEEGVLETVICDNGRRIHSFTTKDKLLQSYSYYDTYSLEMQCSYVYDSNHNLIKYTESGRNGNREQRHILKYEWYE